MDQQSEHPQYILGLVGDVLAVLLRGAPGFPGSCITYWKYRSSAIFYNLIKLVCNESMVDLCQLDEIKENGRTSSTKHMRQGSPEKNTHRQNIAQQA